MDTNIAKDIDLVRMQRSGATPHPPPEKVAKALDLRSVAIKWLAGDGSDRCYYRIFAEENDQTFVLMQLSPNDAKLLENHGYDWILIANILSHFKIPCPKVMATLPEDAALIIEDYGDTMLETLLSVKIRKNEFSETLPTFLKCFSMIAAMLSIPRSDIQIWCQRAFDQEKYQWELAFFKKQFLENILRASFDKKQTRYFESDSKALSIFLAGKSNYFVHRDFHTRISWLREIFSPLSTSKMLGLDQSSTIWFLLYLTIICP